MKYDAKEGKQNIILGFIIFILLLVICILLYVNNWINKDSSDMDVNTVVNFDGGTDSLSLELENLIPYVTVNNKDYKSAYQDNLVTIKDIDNKILLTKGMYSVSESKIDSNELINIVSNMYGNDKIIVNESFNVNGKNNCEYINQEYVCNILDYEGILYKADRDIENISISDDKIYLDESILFYSEESIDGVVEYKVYSNGLYEEVLLEFNSNDVNEDNLTLDEYINKHLTRRRVSYRSSFIINNDHYNWISTEIL